MRKYNCGYTIILIIKFVILGYIFFGCLNMLHIRFVSKNNINNDRYKLQEKCCKSVYNKTVHNFLHKKDTDVDIDKKTVNIFLDKYKGYLYNSHNDKCYISIQNTIITEIFKDSEYNFKLVYNQIGKKDDSNSLRICIKNMNEDYNDYNNFIPYYNIFHSKIQRYDSVLNMNNKVKIALIANNNILNEYLHSIYKNSVFIYYDTSRQCLDAVKNGDADCTFMIDYIANYYIRNYHYENIISFIQDFKFSAGISLKNSDIELQNLILKNIKKLNKEYIDNIICVNIGKLYSKICVDNFAYKYPNLAILISIFIVTIVFTIVILITNNKMNIKHEMELGLALKEAKTANSTKSLFLSKISHSMRTPMNEILGLTYLLKDVDNVDDLHNEIEQIENSGKYLLQLINDILDVNEIVDKRIELKPKINNIKVISENIKAIATRIANEKNINIIWNDHDIVNEYAKFDAVRLEQILINVITNAINFTSSGGKIEVTTNKVLSNEYLYSYQVIVKDNGVGISENYINNIYEPFSQENSETTSTTTGTGLGMTIVKSLLELMNGYINIESKKGCGTKVVMEFSVHTIYESCIAKDYIFDYSILKNINVLVCEDHPINSLITVKILEKKGCYVEVAENGKIGLDKYLNSQVGFFDVILMDIRMPIMDGLETAERIRLCQRNDSNKIVIIAITANTYQEDIENCLRVGMNAHLAKPIDPDNLYKVLCNLLYNKNI